MNNETKKLPYEDELIEMYKNGEKLVYIKEKLKISSSQLYNIIDKYGIQRRESKHIIINKPKAKTKSCPHCRNKNNPAGAKFCCMCGNDIRSEAEILCEELLKVNRAITDFCPSSVVDESVSIVSRAIKLLSKM